MNIRICLTAWIALVLLAGASFGQENISELSQYYGFGQMEVLKLDWGVNSLRIADFDNDGKKDIAVVNNKKAKIEIFLQKDEFGTEESEVSVDQNDVDINLVNPPSRFKNVPVSISEKIYSFFNGDFNNDGLMDIAYYGEPKGLYVLLQKKDEDAGKSKTKSLSWKPKKKIKIEDGSVLSSALACGDLNNDKKTDIALAGKDCVYVILQKDDGTLAEPVKYPTESGLQIRGIEIGDLNGDKINDLVLITIDKDKPMNVRFGLEGGELGAQVKYAIETPWALDLENIDNKDGTEILAIDSVSGRLICYKASDAKDKDKDIDWPIFFYPLASGENSNKRDLQVGDFDGDGLADIVISEPAAAEIVFYKQIAGIGLAKPEKFPALSDIDSMSAVNIDNDKRTDLGVLSIKEKVIGISVFEKGRLTYPKSLEITGEPVAMDMKDIDGDGKVDCAYISKDANDSRFLRVKYSLKNDLKEKDSKKEDDSFLKIEKLTSNPDGIAVVDVDQDGLMDVLVFDKYNPPPILIRQKQKRVFEVMDSGQSQASLIKEATLNSIAIGDLDNKKGNELLIAQGNFARRVEFGQDMKWKTIDQYNAKSTENAISAVGIFDLEKDKKASLVMLDGQKGQLQILKPDDENVYRFEKEIDVGRWGMSKNAKILYASVNDKKTKSIILFDSEKFAIIAPPQVSKVPTQMEQLFVYETKIKDGVYGNMTAGDINNDGKMDLVMVDYKNHNIEILALDSDYKPMPAMRFKLFEAKNYREGQNAPKSTVEPRELDTADVTGDGKNDLVIIIHDRILIYPQD